MSCISISSCLQAYHQLNHIKLGLLSEHFWNTYNVNIKNDIIPIVESNLEFKHTGALTPVFFGDSVKKRWVCNHCKMFIRDDFFPVGQSRRTMFGLKIAR